MSVTRRYPRALWILLALVLVVTTLPYLLAYARAGDAWRFTGFVFAVEDGNSYIAKMLRGSMGDWLFRTPYTALPQRGALVYSFFLLLGKLAAPPALHEQLVALYHLTRWLAVIACGLASYDFLALYVRQERWRLWGVLLALLGGGLGWVLLLTGSGETPLAFYSPESFGFLMVFGLPHLALARALFLWGLRAFLRAADGRTAVQAGLFWLATSVLQPLTVLVAWALIGAHLLLETLRRKAGREHWQRTLVAGLVSSPLVLYTFLVFQFDPFLKRWGTQNVLPSPPPTHYLLAYLPMLPLLWPTLRRWRSAGPSERFLHAWLLLFPLLVYFPYPVQRRLGEGFFLALLALALAGVERSLRARRLAPWLFSLALPATALLLTTGLLAVRQPALPIFRPADEVAAFEWLAEHADPQAVVLTSYATGNALPAWAPVFVVIGHGPESVGLAEIAPRVAAFYRSETGDAARRALLDEFEVDYVFWGPAERALGDWDPHDADWLRPLYAAGGYWIFAP